MIYYFVALSILILALPQKVYAYLDPGTGSYIFQIIIGLLLGGLFFVRSFIKSFFLSIIHLFKRRLPKKTVDEK